MLLELLQNLLLHQDTFCFEHFLASLVIRRPNAVLFKIQVLGLDLDLSNVKLHSLNVQLTLLQRVDLICIVVCNPNQLLLGQGHFLVGFSELLLEFFLTHGELLLSLFELVLEDNLVDNASELIRKLFLPFFLLFSCLLLVDINVKLSMQLFNGELTLVDCGLASLDLCLQLLVFLQDLEHSSAV